MCFLSASYPRRWPGLPDASRAASLGRFPRSLWLWSGGGLGQRQRAGGLWQCPWPPWHPHLEEECLALILNVTWPQTDFLRCCVCVEGQGGCCSPSVEKCAPAALGKAAVTPVIGQLSPCCLGQPAGTRHYCSPAGGTDHTDRSLGQGPGESGSCFLAVSPVEWKGQYSHLTGPCLGTGTESACMNILGSLCAAPL